MNNYSQQLTKRLIHGLIFGGAFAIGALTAFAWTSAPSSPPNSDVSAPINVGSGSQVKTGPLEVNGFQNDGTEIVAGSMSVGKLSSPSFTLDVNGTSNAAHYCINGANCISSWPSGGGGTITSVSAGTGLSGGGSSGNVTLNLNISPSCSSGQALQGFNANGSPSCVSVSGGTPTLDQVLSSGNSSSRSMTVGAATLGSGSSVGAVYFPGSASINANYVSSGQVYTGETDANKFCFNGGSCITSWPTGGGTETLDQVLAAGNSSSRTMTVGSDLTVGGGGAGTLHLYGSTVYDTGNYLHLGASYTYADGSLCLGGTCRSSWPTSAHFGGMWMSASNGVSRSNPLGGGLGCPGGYTDAQIDYFQDQGGVWHDIHFCYQ